MSDLQNNPLINGLRIGKYDAIPFDQIKTEHFIPAVDFALEDAKASVNKIREDKSEPDFDNTILAMETAGELLSYVTRIYFNLMGSESDNEFKALVQEIGPKTSMFSSSVMLDPVLFEKVKKVYDKRNELGLTAEQIRLVENNYKGFAQNGALLDDEAKKKLMEINQQLSTLSPQYSQNLLAATNAFELHVTDKDELAGLPESALAAAAHLAKAKGKEEGWMFNLQVPSIVPVVTYAENRELRKKINFAFGSRSFGGEFDNRELLKKIACLRYKRAQLLGFNTHADYTLTERMAEKPENVMNFLNELYDQAMPAAKNEIAELIQFAKDEDNLEGFYSWDSGYYAEKLKKKKYNFDEEELKLYFKLENVVDGIFTIANKLYGLDIKEVNDIPVYHKDVKTYEVTNKGEFVGLLYIDLFPRETKRGGAWMTSFRGQGLSEGEIRRPHVSIVANLTPPTDSAPSLLRLSEVTTLFHEFGHALHGLLSDCTYSSLASPNVYWDFVELPSQIMENWVTEKEALDLFAKHYETGEKISDELIEKVKAAKTFNAGMACIRQLSLGMLDMAWHAQDPTSVEDVAAFENEVLEKTRLLTKVEGVNTSCTFAHIFAGGYSSGYYSYKWAEVLEADAFEKFKEEGIFNVETAASFRDNILSKGNTAHPMDLFVNFRGRKPDPDALLRRDGLI